MPRHALWALFAAAGASSPPVAGKPPRTLSRLSNHPARLGLRGAVDAERVWGVVSSWERALNAEAVTADPPWPMGCTSLGAGQQYPPTAGVVPWSLGWDLESCGPWF